MTRHVQLMTLATTALAACVITPRPALAAQDRGKDVRDEIRHQLLQLPYYGVFDFLAFKYDRGTAELTGYAYSPTLKEDAEHAVKRVSGVDTVLNHIEQLPASQQDNELRWKLYYSIYSDPFLQKYAPGGTFLWGHRHRAGPFAGIYAGGYEPAGDYPIHIIVRNGRVTLLGVVDDQGDRTIAEMRARQVPGSFEIKDELIVEKSQNRRS